MTEAPPLFDFQYDERMPRFDAARWGYGPPPGTAMIGVVCLLLAAGSGGLLAARDLLIGRAPDIARDRDRGRERAPPTARAPDPLEVGRAYEQVRVVYARDGLPGLAREGASCFAALERTPDYRRLDYCLAFDAFAGGVSRVVNAASPESRTYFNEATVRHIRATDAVGASRPEANARLRLVSRIATNVAQTRARTAPLVLLPPLPPEPEVDEVTVAVPPSAVEEAPYRVLGPGESVAAPPVEAAEPAEPSPPAPTPPAPTPPPPVSN